jgi:hypothetical protein
MTRQLKTISAATEGVINTYEIMTKEQMSQKKQRKLRMF